MRNASIKTAPWIVQVAALVVAVSIGCLGAFAADASGMGISVEQILPVQHGVATLGIQVAPAGDLGGEQASFAFGVLFQSVPDVQGPKQTWSDKPEPRDIRWREIFLLSRFNTKYK